MKNRATEQVQVQYSKCLKASMFIVGYISCVCVLQALFLLVCLFVCVCMRVCVRALQALLLCLSALAEFSNKV